MIDSVADGTAIPIPRAMTMSPMMTRGYDESAPTPDSDEEPTGRNREADRRPAASSRRAPPAEERPARPTTYTSANGISRTPASSGSYPSTNWNIWLTRNRVPTTAKNDMVIAMLATVNRGLRKNVTSSIGYGFRNSHSTKAARPRHATAKPITLAALSQPRSGAPMIVQRSTERPTIDSSEPTRSSGAGSGSFDSGRTKCPIETAITTTGTFTRKTDPHQKWARRSPPTAGPSALPSALTAAQIPMARPRSLGSVKRLVRIESVAGMMSAAPIPMHARAAITCVVSAANAAATDDVPNTSNPMVSARLRPKRSPRLPAVRSRPANTSTYASTIHWRSDVDAWRSRASVGSAMLRIEPSIPITIKLKHRTPRLHQRRRYTTSGSSESGIPPLSDAAAPHGAVQEP